MGQLFKEAFLRAVSQRDSVDESTLSSKNLTAVVLCNEVRAAEKKASNHETRQIEVEQIKTSIGADTDSTETLLASVDSAAPFKTPHKDSAARQDQPPKSSKKKSSTASRAGQGGPGFNSANWLKNFKHPGMSASALNPHSSTPRYPHLRQPRPQPKILPDQITISIAANAKMIWPGVLNGDADLLAVDEHAGIPVQCHVGKSSTTRELTITCFHHAFMRETIIFLFCQRVWATAVRFTET